MDWTVSEQKLESLRHCLRRGQEKCPPDMDTLVKDIDAQDILTLNLTRAVQLCGYFDGSGNSQYQPGRLHEKSCGISQFGSP